MAKRKAARRPLRSGLLRSGRPVAKAQSRAGKRVRRAAPARSAGAGKRKAVGTKSPKTAKTAARGAKTTAGARKAVGPTAKARSVRTSKPSGTKRAKVAVRKAVPRKVRNKVRKVDVRKPARTSPPARPVLVARPTPAVKPAVKPIVSKVAAATVRPEKPVRKAASPTETSRRRRLPDLNRERRRAPDDDVEDPASKTPPSSLGLNRTASAARSGRQELRERYDNHNETGPVLTAGDVDADWESAYAVGDEAPGGDNPTPDQNVVDDIGLAVGVAYDDNEELEGADRIEERDRHRWEFDPASSDDFDER